MRQRSAYHSAEFFTLTRGTAQVTGFALPGQAWEEFGRLATGTELVVIASDFDRRASTSFEAIVTVEASGPRALVLRSTAEPAGPDEIEMLARLLGARGLEPSEGGVEYGARLKRLGGTIAVDPSAGLRALGEERRALFASHASELLKSVIGHESADEALLEEAMEFCLRPPAGAHAFRGYLALGGARKRLEEIARNPKAGRTLVVRIALSSLESLKERELVVLACLERKVLEAGDLRVIAAAVAESAASSGEKARMLRDVCAHGSADASTLLEVVALTRRLDFDADRRDVLVAAGLVKRSAAVRAAVVAAAGELEFEGHRRDVLKATEE